MDIDIHIGTHKTGSTAFQQMLSFNRDRLMDNKIIFYEGMILKNNHVEISEVCLRENLEKMIDFRPESKILKNLKYQSLCKDISNYIDRKKNLGIKKIIFSSESLSLFREHDEVLRLKNLFPKYCNIRIFVVLRDKHSYLKKYADQINRLKGRKQSEDYSSALYVKADTWLIDFEALIKIYKSLFNEVIVIEYNKKDTIKHILKAMDLNINSKLKTRMNSGSIFLRKYNSLLSKIKKDN